MTPVDRPSQRSCTHCGDCVRACPESLDPQALFLALAADDWSAARAGRLDACSECNRCAQVCPSNIPLPDWFRWGKPELAVHARADAARARFLARTARVARERQAPDGGPPGRAPSDESPAAMPTRTISRDEVLAAIARGKAKRRDHP